MWLDSNGGVHSLTRTVARLLLLPFAFTQADQHHLRHSRRCYCLADNRSLVLDAIDEVQRHKTAALLRIEISVHRSPLSRWHSTQLRSIGMSHGILTLGILVAAVHLCEGLTHGDLRGTAKQAREDTLRVCSKHQAQCSAQETCSNQLRNPTITSRREGQQGPSTENR